MVQGNIRLVTLLFLCSMICFNNISWAQVIKQDDPVVKILTFNILHGATTKGDFDLDTIAAVISKFDPDFVALQEVDFKTNRAKGYDLVTELASRTGMIPLFGKAMSYDGGEYGEGILSKYSFVSTRNIALPYLDGYEPRAALEITSVISSGDTINFIGTHLDHTEDGTNRIMQAEKINSVFSENVYPTIMAGDLNDIPGSRAINILETFWTSSYDQSDIKLTYPSHNPNQKIDYVMFHPADRWEVVGREVLCDTIASDHCAYLVLLRLKK